MRVFKAGTSVCVISQFGSCRQLTVRSNTTLQIALRWAGQTNEVRRRTPVPHVSRDFTCVSFDLPCLIGLAARYCRCSPRNACCIESEISSPCFSSHIPVETELQTNQRCGSGRGTVMRVISDVFLQREPLLRNATDAFSTVAWLGFVAPGANENSGHP